MRRAHVRLLGLVLLLGAGACRVTPPMATAADAERSHVALETLEQGRALLVRKCGGACHRTPLPAQHRANEWPSHLDEMSTRAGLLPAQRALIEQYLVAMAPK